MYSRFPLNVALALSLGAPLQLPLLGQRPGDPVRLTLTDSRRIQGIFAAWRDSVLTLADTVLAAQDVIRLEVGVLRSREALAAGIIAGALTGDSFDQPVSGEGLFATLGVALAVGSFVRLVSPRRWVESPLRPTTPPPNQELEPRRARGLSARASAGVDAAEKDELCLCDNRQVARGSIPARYAAPGQAA